MVREDVSKAVGEYLSSLIRLELEAFLGRKPYERRDGDGNHRNGYYHRHFSLKRLGQVLVKVAPDRRGKFRSLVLPRSKRYEQELRQDICLMYLTGISTATLSLISEKLLGRKISAGEVSRVSKELMEAAASWREFFKDLKCRGLRAELVQLGVMDGILALEEVFKEEFPKAEVQRCIVHLTRNVLAKVPKKLKGQVASELKDIFYAPSEKEARERFAEFKRRWEEELPSAVACLERALESALSFFKFPAEEWLGLRTTNIIERLNKEFKRRTKVMEIVASEKALNNLLAFICLKMEIHWRKSPMGRVLSAMFKPQLEAANEFTQNA